MTTTWAQTAMTKARAALPRLQRDLDGARARLAVGLKEFGLLGRLGSSPLVVVVVGAAHAGISPCRGLEATPDVGLE